MTASPAAPGQAAAPTTAPAASSPTAPPTAPAVPDRLDAFLAFSSRVTAFSVFDLLGTGQAEAYLAAVTDAVGEDVVADLLAADATVAERAGGDEDRTTELLRAEVFSDDRLGPVARGVVKVWYLGTWYALPSTWHEAYGGRGADATAVVSATAYTEGLVWPAIGANPPGAKGPGYGTWALPPQVALPALAAHRQETGR